MSPLTENLEIVLGISKKQLGTCINLGFIVELCFFGLYASYCIDKYGCRVSLLVGNLLLLVVLGLRLLMGSGLVFLVASYIILGFTFPLCYNMITTVVRKSFPVESRGLANAIASLSIPFGFVFGLASSSIFCDYLPANTTLSDSQKEYYLSQITKFICFDLIYAVLCLGLNYFFYEEMSGFDFSAEDAEFSMGKFVDNALQLLQDRNYLRQLVSYCLFCGVMMNLMMQIGLISTFYVLDQNYMNYTLEVGIVFSVFSTVYAGWLVDRYKCYKGLLLGLFLVNFVLTLLFFTCSWTGHHNVAYVTALLIIVFASPNKSLNLETAAEMTYPVATGTSTGLLEYFNNITIPALGYAITILFGTDQYDKWWSNVSVVGVITCMLLAGILIFADVHIVFKRSTETERKRSEHMENTEFMLVDQDFKHTKTANGFSEMKELESYN